MNNFQVDQMVVLKSTIPQAIYIVRKVRSCGNNCYGCRSKQYLNVRSMKNKKKLATECSRYFNKEIPERLYKRLIECD